MAKEEEIGLAVDSASVRVLVVAGYSSVRAGLQALLAAEPNLRLLGDAPTTGPIARLLTDLHPDVLVLDTAGDGAGEDSVGRLLALLSDDGNTPSRLLPSPLTMVAPVVIGDAPDRDLPRLAEAGLPGWAYLQRDAAGPQIIAAVRAAAAGLVVLDAGMSLPGASGNRTGRTIDEPIPGETLTPREIEVLALMAEGLPNKIIASRLKISLHTAKFHVAQILGKLNAASRTEAVTTGARRGYLTL